MEDSGPPPASDERIAALPLVDVSDELIGEWIWRTESHSCLQNFEYMCAVCWLNLMSVPPKTKLSVVTYDLDLMVVVLCCVQREKSSAWCARRSFRRTAKRACCRANTPSIRTAFRAGLNWLVAIRDVKRLLTVALHHSMLFCIV